MLEGCREKQFAEHYVVANCEWHVTVEVPPDVFVNLSDRLQNGTQVYVHPVLTTQGSARLYY